MTAADHTPSPATDGLREDEREYLAGLILRECSHEGRTGRDWCCARCHDLRSRILAAHPAPPSETATEECEDGVFGSQDIADALGGRGPLTAPPSSLGADRDAGLTLAEISALNLADDRHDYPTETDDGLVMRCRCGATPPAHYLGQQVDEALWLWEHRRRERHAVVERILAARAEVQP